MFQNKVVIVTGAAQGIGKEVATQYAKSGAKVVLADLNEQLGEAINDNLKEQGYNTTFVKTDVRQEADIINLMKTTVERYSTIDILINNAGVFKICSPLDLDIDSWDDVINTNLRSVFYVHGKLQNICD